MSNDIEPAGWTFLSDRDLSDRTLSDRDSTESSSSNSSSAASNPTVTDPSDRNLPDKKMTGKNAHPAGVGASQRLKISRPLLNLALDFVLMLNFVALAITSVILQFVFPPGVAARGWMLWGLNHSRWSSLQFMMLSVLGLGIVVHVMLHWTWVCGVIVRQIFKKSDLPDDGIRTLSGVGLLIGLLLLGAFITGAATLSIHTPEGSMSEEE